MAPPAKTLTITELAALFRVTREAIHGWRKAGCPTRKESGRPVFDLPDVIAWKIERAKESGRDAETPDEGKERARKIKAEADLKELEVARVRGTQIPVEEYRERAESFVGGFGAVAAGQLHRFERDIVKATTAVEARKLTGAIHAALMSGAQEYADTLEAELEATEVEAA